MLFLSLMKQNDVKMAFAFSHRFLCGVGKNKLIGRPLDVFLRKRGVTIRDVILGLVPSIHGPLAQARG